MYNKSLLSQLSVKQQDQYLKNKRLDYAANKNDINDIKLKQAQNRNLSNQLLKLTAQGTKSLFNYLGLTQEKTGQQLQRQNNPLQMVKYSKQLKQRQSIVQKLQSQQDQRTDTYASAFNLAPIVLAGGYLGYKFVKNAYEKYKQRQQTKRILQMAKKVTQT